MCKVRSQRHNSVIKKKIFLLGFIDRVFELLNLFGTLRSSLDLLVVKTLTHGWYFGFFGFGDLRLNFTERRVVEIIADRDELNVAKDIFHMLVFLGQY